MYTIFKFVFSEMETIKIVLKNFTRTTSSHGIPQIGYSNSILVRIFWLLIFCTGFAVFTTQAYSLIAKFMKHEKTVTMELRFEAAPFPAVTVCNLNPYKNSLAQQIPSLRETLQVFEHVRKSSKFRAPPTDTSVDDKVRVKRELTYDPVLAFCDCPNINFECTPYLKPRDVHPTRCYCFRNRDYQTVSPCYNEKMWTTLDCVECSYTGRCTHPTGKVDPAIRSRKCLCPALANYCVLQKSQIETIGDPMLFTTTTTTSTTSPTSTSTTTTTSTTPTTTTATSTTSTTTTTTASPSTSTTTEPYTGPTTIDPTMIENLGYGDMTDGVTIATKAMENLLFTIASLDTYVRIGLSYGKHEMINMCSFNGKQCDIENDFTHSIDPVYGNCYIFNYESQHSNRTSSRAGPMYGLRMLVYSNLSDYMPTTEAAGIRVQIHNQSEQSFPDTFGYSAPTGFISSFGIKLKEVDRLDGPYGECLRNGKTADYLFENKSYSTEGCFRSCFQHFLFNICKCADPRFPAPKGGEYCAADNPVARKCLENVLEEVGGFHGINGCDCRQPCKQSGYSVTYSAAVWPAPFFEVGQCSDNDNESCVETYRKNAAMIEIYYEQLNFEKLEESEAYGFVNLLADFGGQLGLWMGFSVITCVEVIILVIKLITVCCCPAREQDVKEVPDTKRLSLLPDHAVQLEQRNKLIAKNNRSDQSIGGKRLIKDNEYCNCH